MLLTTWAPLAMATTPEVVVLLLLAAVMVLPLLLTRVVTLQSRRSSTLTVTRTLGAVVATKARIKLTLMSWNVPRGWLLRLCRMAPTRILMRCRTLRLLLWAILAFSTSHTEMQRLQLPAPPTGRGPGGS